MPLRDFKCLECDVVEERYYVSSTESKQECEKCGATMEKAPLTASISKSAVFPFTTTHVDGLGTPITVESIGHLRSLEKTYGACFTAFSQNHPDDSPRDLPVARPGGRDYEG